MFKPLYKKYQFDNTLILSIPDYLEQPLVNWLFGVLSRKNLIYVRVYKIKGLRDYKNSFIDGELRYNLQIELREVYPQRWGDFVNYVFGDRDRAVTILQWFLNYYASEQEAIALESILKRGGSGYKVIKTVNNSQTSQDSYDLIKRVPEVVDKISQPALKQDTQLMQAWHSCYGLKSNYNDTVIKCQNVLEKLLKNKYLPKDPKPQLGKLIADILAGSKTLAIKGSDIIDNPNILLNLVENIPKYRGVHKAGTGLDASPDQAEYILHTTIYIWNLHQ